MATLRAMCVYVCLGTERLRISLDKWKSGLVSNACRAVVNACSARTVVSNSEIFFGSNMGNVMLIIVLVRDHPVASNSSSKGDVGPPVSGDKVYVSLHFVMSMIVTVRTFAHRTTTGDSGVVVS